MLLLLGHGRLSLGEIMHYAIGYARAGYPVLPDRGNASVAQVFREHWPGSAPHGSDSTARPAFWAASRSSSPGAQTTRMRSKRSRWRFSCG